MAREEEVRGGTGRAGSRADQLPQQRVSAALIGYAERIHWELEMDLLFTIADIAVMNEEWA